MTITTTPASGKLLDQDARRAALTERRLGLVVEAGAGSGKTAILAGRVALLLADGVAPASIAAITFTELAAAELATRIGEYVDALAAGTVPVTMAAAFAGGGPSHEQHRNLAAARTSLDELTCSTIHGFARELVRPYPVEADMDPGAAVMDADEQALLFADVFEGWLREALGERPAGTGDAAQSDLEAVSPAGNSTVARFVIADDKNKRETLEALARLLHQHPDLRPAAAPDMGHLAERVVMLCRDFHQYVHGHPGAAEVVGPLLEQVPQLAQAFSGWGAEGEDAFRLLTMERPTPLFTQSGGLRKLRAKGRWVAAGREAGQSKSEAEDAYQGAEAIHSELDEALQAVSTAAADSVLAGLCEELKEVGHRYQERKRAAAVLDFDDLIRTALELLRNHPAVREQLAAKYQHVLIDEFQDTDPLQAEIYWRLTGVPSGDDWRTWPSRTGSRFVVGDPKQSIYRFRGADASTYAALTDSLRADANSRTLELNTNFRSRAPILHAVNETFAEPLEAEGQPGYRPLNAWHGPAAAPGVARLLVPDPMETLAADNIGAVRAVEAETVAALVRDLVDGASDLLPQPVPPGHIALLAPSGTGLDVYERALDALGLNVASQAGKGFYRRQEVQDLVALTRVLADPRDRLALGALLKGPLVGATDEELLDATDLLSHLENDDRYLNVLTDTELLLEGPVRRTLERLKPLVLQRFGTTPHELLSRALEALDVRAVLQHRHGEHADRALANVDRFLEHSRAFDQRGLIAFARHVWAAWADNENELEGRADSGSEAVTLITIHSAKGLEWPVVIPVNTASTPQGVSGVLHDRRTGALAMSVLGHPCSGYQELRELEEQEQAAERLRLWYVAATRASELLVVPQYTSGQGAKAWCNLVEWLPGDAPVVEVEVRERGRRTTDAQMHTAQTREQFLEEFRIVEAGSVRIERRAPSRRDDQSLSALAADGGKAQEGSERKLLDEEGAAKLLSAIDERAGGDPQTEHRLHIGPARGILLHKLMEELINGETVATAPALTSRAGDLAGYLEIDAEEFDATEVGELAYRTWHLPEVAALHDRLQAEVEVAGVDPDPEDPAGQIYWGGIADAVALDEHGQVETVIDWKSDRNPNDELLEHYREQIRAYLHLTGARQGLLVLCTSGRVLQVSSD